MNIVQNNPHAFQNIMLCGKQEYIKCADILKNAENAGDMIAPLLDKSDGETLKAGIEAAAVQKINDKFKSSLQLSRPPDERITVTRKIRYATGNCISEVKSHHSFYEKNEKVYQNLEEREEWQPRILMIERAYACQQIFSLSIVPTDPSVVQTWYDRKNVCQKEILPPIDLVEFENLFGAIPQDQDVANNSSEMKVDILTSDKKAHPYNTIQRLTGFFMPFPGFSSELAKPHHNPDSLDHSVNVIEVFSEEKRTKAIESFESASLKERIQNVLDAFVDDLHSQGIGLTVIDASQVKVLYFKK